MTTTFLRYFSTALIVGAAAAATAAGQSTAPSGLLNKARVQELAKNATTPAEHQQLRDHFIAIAERYEADAKRHASMPAVLGNPNRTSADTGVHWKRLSEAETAVAKSARELAMFHGQLAAGVAATKPADPAHLEHGTGAPVTLSDTQLRQLVASAQTPADHARLREYFESLVTMYTADADTHAAMAAGYRVNANRRTPGADPAVHCDRLVQQARAAAAEAKALAAEHVTPSR